jgi:hypothetical protein
MTPADLCPSSNVNIQIMTGAPTIELGHVALIIHNCPIIMIQNPNATEDSPDSTPVPGVKLTARQAMEIGMNLIHIAKIAEEFANSVPL